MNFTPVISSNISGACHDGEDMFLRFNKDDAVYVYRQVPYEVYEELLAADSVGKYFHSSIRDRFVAERYDKTGP